MGKIDGLLFLVHTRSKFEYHQGRIGVADNPYLVERELHLHADEELLVPKDELQDVDHPHDEVHGVEESTHAAPTIKGRKSIFRLCLFLDIWIMSMDCRLLFMDDWSSWEKIDGLLFLDHSGVTALSKYRTVKYY